MYGWAAEGGGLLRRWWYQADLPAHDTHTAWPQQAVPTSLRCSCSCGGGYSPLPAVLFLLWAARWARQARPS